MLSVSAVAGSLPNAIQSAPPNIHVAEPWGRLGRSTGPADALARGVVKLSPQEAVMKAADAYPGRLIAVVEMVVKGIGPSGSDFYLNSEADYRDPRNISIRIRPSAIPTLQAQYGARLSDLIGKKIWVVGPIRRTRIDFTIAGIPSGKYYFQTHQIVDDGSQVELAN